MPWAGMAARFARVWNVLAARDGMAWIDVTHLTDEVVVAIIVGPILLWGVVAGYVFGLRRRIKKLERKADIEDVQWRER